MQDSNRPYQDPNQPYQNPADPSYRDPNRPRQEPLGPQQASTGPYQESPRPYQDPNQPYPAPTDPYQTSTAPSQQSPGGYQDPNRPYQDPYQTSTAPSQQPPAPHQQPPAPSQNPTGSYQQQPPGPHQNPTESSPASKLVLPKVTPVKRLMHNRVMNSAGEELGSIEELAIDLTSGRIAYAVLFFSSFLGLGNKLFAIPWDALRLSTHDNTFILNVEKEVLKKAPGFDRNNWPDMADPRWSADIHGYYGQQPYR